MRVAVIHNLPPGGARRRMGEHVRWMGHEVVEICPSTASPVTGDPIVVPLTTRAERLHRLLRPPIRYADHVAASRAWREVARRIERVKPDVIYANPCRYFQAPPALRWTERPSLYFCDEPRRVDHEAAAASSRRRGTVPMYAPLYAMQRRADGVSTARASHLCTNSRHSAARILSAYGREAEVAPMGVPAAFGPNGEPSGERVVSVGALIPTKGHDLVIQAAGVARTRRPVTVVAPRADPAEQRRLHAIAEAAGVSLDVRVAISDEELRQCLRSAHAVMYLAREEPFGLVALEAQACGTPVVVSDEGGLPETLLTERTGYAVARNAEAAAQALDRLDDPARRAELSAGAAEFAAGQTWERAGVFIGDALAAVVDRA
ncbi:MAG TPA: glycosyltransferase family 4 protein [Solirubrobacteraceae bacterium]|nr:glycosyltransferase family 4 protein [Solirubrobacteraceae bacterium]